VRARRATLPALLLAAVLVTVTPASPLTPPARAEHEVAYRYTVLGYVTDARGHGRGGVRVELARERTGFSYLGETDADGFYVIITRLGDESAGETLALRAGAEAVTVTVRFDPSDHTTERGTRVDFTSRRPIESPTLFVGTLRRFLAQ
jgi:hypothetical protein